jgi:CO/xanthine dehydrogenase Mo-binding subunit
MTMQSASPARRTVLRLAATAVVSLTLGFRLDRAAAESNNASTPFQPNALLRIDTTGAVTVLISKTEMGQGTETGIAMIVADELDADWAQVSVQTVRPDSKRFMVTGGSYSTAGAWASGRRAAAAAREMFNRPVRRRWAWTWPPAIRSAMRWPTVLLGGGRPTVSW